MPHHFFSRFKLSVASWAALILGVIFFAASIAPTPYRFFVSPPGQMYNGTTESWSDDYSAYVSYIIQGQQGKWLACDTHTSEPNMPCIPIHSEYVLWGKFMGILGIDPIVSYQLFRFVLGAILIFLCWNLIKLVFPHRTSLQLTAYFLLLFVGGLPKVLPNGTPNLTIGPWSWAIDSYIPWITELGIFLRFISLPHYLLGNIFFVLSIIQFLKFQSQKFLILNSKFLILVLFGLGAGFVHAASLVTLYVTFGIYFLLTSIIKFVISPKKALSQIPFYSLFTRRRLDEGELFTLKNLSANFLGLTAYIVLTSPILFYFKYLLTFQPWANLSAAWEATTFYYISPDVLALAIGPTIFLAPLGFLLLAAKPTKEPTQTTDDNLSNALLLLSWPLSFFLLFYFSHPFLKISQVRFLQSYFFIPLAILAAPVIIFFAEKLSSFTYRLKQKVKLLPLVPFFFSALLLTFIVALPTLPLLYHNFTFRFTFFRDFSVLVYPPKNWVNAIYWLRDNTPRTSVVLSAWQAGHHIPFLAGNYVYFGHLWGTLNLPTKRDLAEKFFRGQMEEPEARQFLKDGRINYLFWSYEEASYGGHPEQYRNLLSPVYSTPGATIFRIKD